MSVFRKHDDGPVSTALEAQGLAWLAEAMADGGAHVVPVTSGPGWLEEPRLTTTSVTPAGAEAFGRALAVTHAAGAPAFGAAPPGWDGRARLRDGDVDTDQPALVRAGARARGARVAVARTHGDLWCGNVLWTPADEAAQWAPPRAGLGPQASSSGEALAGSSASRATVVGVLIDPMAQGAHAETDLAALGVFGQRYLDRIYAAYHEVSPLAAGWRERVGLHSWHIIMIHAFLFGGGYGGEAVAVARQYL